MLYYSRNKASIPPGLGGPLNQVNICNGLPIPVKSFFDRRWVPWLLAPHFRARSMVGLETDTGGPEERVFLSFLELHWFFSPLLNGSGPSCALPSLFHTTTSCICSLLLFSYSFPDSFILLSPNLHLFSSFFHVTQVHVRRDLQDGRGEGWDGWKYSNNVGDHFQVKTLSQ